MTPGRHLLLFVLVYLWVVRECDPIPTYVPGTTMPVRWSKETDKHFMAVAAYEQKCECLIYIYVFSLGYRALHTHARTHTFMLGASFIIIGS